MQNTNAFKKQYSKLATQYYQNLLHLYLLTVCQKSRFLLAGSKLIGRAKNTRSQWRADEGLTGRRNRASSAVGIPKLHFIKM